jgi:hypothetical protein
MAAPAVIADTGSALFMRDQQVAVGESNDPVRKLIGTGRMVLESPTQALGGQHGSRFPTIGTYRGQRRASFVLGSEFFHQDAHMWLAGSTHGETAPDTALTGTTPTKTASMWKLWPTGLNNDRLPFTFEWKDGNQWYRCDHAELNQYTIRATGQGNGAVMQDMTFLAYDRTALSPNTPVNLSATPAIARTTLIGSQTKVYLTTLAANLGKSSTPNTQVTGRVVSWSWGINQNLSYGHYCDGSLGASTLEPGYRSGEVSLVMRLNAQTEMAQWENGTLVYCRFELPGPRIGAAYADVDQANGSVTAPVATGRYNVYLDSVFVWQQGMIAEQGNVSVLNLTTLPQLDATLNVDVRATVFNDYTDFSV